MPDIAQLPKRSRRQVTSGTKGKLERQADLLIGEVRGQQLQGVSNGDGSPGLHEIGSLPCLLSITPINTLQELGQCSGFASQAVPEAPHHCSLLYVQRPAAHVSAFCHLLLALYCKVAVRMFAHCFGLCNAPKATVHLLQYCALCSAVACNTCLLLETGNLHGRQKALTIMYKHKQQPVVHPVLHTDRESAVRTVFLSQPQCPWLITEGRVNKYVQLMTGTFLHTTDTHTVSRTTCGAHLEARQKMQGVTIDLDGSPVGRVQQDGINLALLLHIRLEVSVHQAPSDTACQLLSLELAGVLPPHLAGKQCVSSRAMCEQQGFV